ncbi:hypothetical protein PROPEN_03163 [Proteus penneri ATCC 35198]|nr:hypothetical protein PROPEN_03163 [Proteus penneri ATCC 35198]
MYRKLLIVSVSLSLLGCAASTPNQNDKSTLLLRPDVRHFTLDNGLDVYLLQRPQPGVEMRLLVKSGSVQEDEKQLGSLVFHTLLNIWHLKVQHIFQEQRALNNLKA